MVSEAQIPHFYSKKLNMIWIYRILFLPLLVILMPYYAMRMIRRGGYAKDFSHRFGFQKKLPNPENGKKRIWIQAVSVGEVEALSSLLKLLFEDGKFEVVVTTTTSTGYKILREKYSKFCYYVGIFPFDFWLTNALAWRRIKPDMCIQMEGELWPEHLYRAKAKNKPLLLLNARLSDRSFGRYSKFGYFARRIFNRFNAIACGSEFDAARFLKLGAKKEIVSVTGNIKFDASNSATLSDEEREALKIEMGFTSHSLILLGSSTWAGEEEMLTEFLADVRKKTNYDLRLLLVPRHAERRDEIKKLLQKGELSFNFRTENKEAQKGNLIYVADTTGELARLTQIADFAYVGKSMPPNDGGQSPLDCAAAGVATVYGPNMTNFKKMCESLEEVKASIKVADNDAAKEALFKLSSDIILRKQMGLNALHWHQSNSGASLRTFAIIKKFAK